MTIDEAIKHCEEKAKELNKDADKAEGLYIKNGCVKTTKEYISECIECAKEHEQLAEWLKDYKRLLEERPQGEWIFRNGVTCQGYYKCSKCGEVERAEKNFCPSCGADMRGETE